MSAAAPDLAPRTGWASLKDLTGYQWFVFIVCCLAWDMDCLDQQLFVLARRPAMTELVAKVTPEDTRLPEFTKKLAEKAAADGKPTPSDQAARTALQNADIADASTYATSFFMLGWAVGGIGFGILGDRYGRVKTLMLTILLYSLFTGLSAISNNTMEFHIYRFLTGLGVGGVFAAAVTLLADTMPSNARPYVLGLFQASSVLGNITAALLSMWFGSLQEQGAFTGHSVLGYPLTPWRVMFLVGIIPGFLVVLIQFKLKEPEIWTKAMAAGGVKKAGSYGELLGDPKWRTRALCGLVLALSGVIGLWGIAFFSPDLQSYVAEPTYKQQARDLKLEGSEVSAEKPFPKDSQADKYVVGQKAYWSGITSLVQNTGAFFGIFAFSIITAYIGRRWTFAMFLILAAASTAMVFMYLNSWSDIFWMVPMMGFFQLALFGGYAIYFPELFPTRLRSTGTSFCYNVGRLIAAVGPFALGKLASVVYADLPAPEPLRYAGLTMCSIFILGLLVLPFLPETKGKPLPE
ncbi:MAG: MFS transporter [Planctomycetaceae bacterium]|nr:MFS transporter [Planctomycetaceae bacterium]